MSNSCGHVPPRIPARSSTPEVFAQRAVGVGARGFWARPTGPPTWSGFEASGIQRRWRRALSTLDAAAAANADRAIRLSAYGFCSSMKPIAHRGIGQLNAGSGQFNAGFHQCWPTQHRSWPIQRGFRPIQRGLLGHGSRDRRPTLRPDKQRQNAETKPLQCAPWRGCRRQLNAALGQFNADVGQLNAGWRQGEEGRSWRLRFHIKR
jgi:hypothetical protein